MKKLSLAEWVEVAELVAAAGVILSLLLVVYSLRENTAALQGGTENLLFESHSALAGQMVTDPSLVEIRLKVREGQALAPVEAVRWHTYQELLLDIWAMAYSRHQDGLLADRAWQSWDVYFSGQFRDGDLRLDQARWQELVGGFDEGFWRHVRGAVLGN